MGFPEKEATLIKGDNNGSIAIAKNPELHQCTKHIEVRWHWVHDLIKEGQIMVTKCKGMEQTTDVLTKVLLCPKH